MNERDFYVQWQLIAPGLSPFEMARQAGAVASSPGLVFIAGYQAAIRATFPSLDASGWCSFAVTEDRTPDTIHPPVTLSKGKVSGVKTWIAAVDSVDLLVLKVGSGRDAVYGSVPAEAKGVTLSSRTARFLMDMSQGSASFDEAPFTPIHEVEQVKAFRQHEPYFIYVAFLARVQAAIPEAADLAAAALAKPDADLLALDRAVAEVLETMEQAQVQFGPHWEADQRLFTMYSPGIQR